MAVWAEDDRNPTRFDTRNGLGFAASYGNRVGLVVRTHGESEQGTVRRDGEIRPCAIGRDGVGLSFGGVLLVNPLSPLRFLAGEQELLFSRHPGHRQVQELIVGQHPRPEESTTWNFLPAR